MDEPAAAASLQSCPTLCDPIDSSPQGSPVPEILQARTLECMNLEPVIKSEVSQKEKNKYHILTHIYGF